MTKKEKEMLAHLLNKAIDFECFLIENEDCYEIYSDYYATIDADGDVIITR